MMGLTPTRIWVDTQSTTPHGHFGEWADQRLEGQDDAVEYVPLSLLTEAVKVLEQSVLPHYREDLGYSCPKHPDACANPEDTECNCGADAHNARIAAVLDTIKKALA
jgi:hypothetical protein